MQSAETSTNSEILYVYASSMNTMHGQELKTMQ